MQDLTALVEQYLPDFKNFQPTRGDYTIAELCEYRDCDPAPFLLAIAQTVRPLNTAQEAKDLYGRLATLAHGILQNYDLSGSEPDQQTNQRLSMLTFCT